MILVIKLLVITLYAVLPSAVWNCKSTDFSVLSACISIIFLNLLKVPLSLLKMSSIVVPSLPSSIILDRIPVPWLGISSFNMSCLCLVVSVSGLVNSIPNNSKKDTASLSDIVAPLPPKDSIVTDLPLSLNAFFGNISILPVSSLIWNGPLPDCTRSLKLALNSLIINADSLSRFAGINVNSKVSSLYIAIRSSLLNLWNCCLNCLCNLNSFGLSTVLSLLAFSLLIRAVIGPGTPSTSA